MHIRCSLADAYNKYIIYIRTILMSSLDKQKKNTHENKEKNRESARNAVDRSEEEMRFIKRYI